MMQADNELTQDDCITASDVERLIDAKLQPIAERINTLAPLERVTAQDVKIQSIVDTMHAFDKRLSELPIAELQAAITNINKWLEATNKRASALETKSSEAEKRSTALDTRIDEQDKLIASIELTAEKAMSGINLTMQKIENRLINIGNDLAKREKQDMEVAEALKWVNSRRVLGRGAWAIVTSKWTWVTSAAASISALVAKLSGVV